jgi:hypothetical protein
VKTPEIDGEKQRKKKERLLKLVQYPDLHTLAFFSLFSSSTSSSASPSLLPPLVFL